MGQHAVPGSCHSVLAHEENTVIQAILEIVVSRSGTALDQLCSRIDIGDRKAAAAVVAVPADHSSSARFEQAFSILSELCPQQTFALKIRVPARIAEVF